MLTPEQVDEIYTKASLLVAAYEKKVCIKLPDFLDFLKANPSLSGERQALREFERYLRRLVSGLSHECDEFLYDYMNKALRVSLGVDKATWEKSVKRPSAQDLAALKEYGVEPGDIDNLNYYWGQIDIDEIAFDFNADMREALEQTHNITHSIVPATSSRFDLSARYALSDVRRGASVDYAIKGAINRILRGGVLMASYDDGYTTSANFALSGHIQASTKNASMHASDKVARATGASRFQVTAFDDCAPDHIWLNGEVFELDMLGDVEAAMERWGCRHTWSPIYDEQDIKDYQMPSNQVIENNYKERQRANRRARYAQKKAMIR